MSTPNAQLTKLALGIAGVAALAAMTGRFSLGAGAVTEALPEPTPSGAATGTGLRAQAGSTPRTQTNAVPRTQANMVPRTQAHAVPPAQTPVPVDVNPAPADPATNGPMLAEREPEGFLAWDDDDEEEEGEEHEHEHEQSRGPIFANPQTQPAPAPAPVVTAQQGLPRPTVAAPTQRTRTRRS